MSRYAWSLLTCIVIVFALGVMMVFNTSSAEVLDRFLDRSTHYALIKQLLYAVVGFVFSLVAWFIGYRDLIKLSSPLLLFFTILLVLVFVPGIGQQINGAHRWINLGGSSFQPSEFVKVLIPLYFIRQVARRNAPLELSSFLKILAKMAVPIGLILMEPDNGCVVIIFVCLFVLFLISSQKWIYWALPFTLLLALGGVVASQMPHVMNRIEIYLHPESDLQGKGHQPHQSKIAAGSGGITGRGIGESLQKLEYLPEARNDYIAAIFAEETGFIGITGLISLYVIIGFCGMAISQDAVDKQGFYTAAILTFLICFQAFLNLGVVSGLLPSKGTNLPFFSQGGSSLLANMVILSIILSVSRSSEEVLCSAKE